MVTHHRVHQCIFLACCKEQGGGQASQSRRSRGQEKVRGNEGEETCRSLLGKGQNLRSILNMTGNQRKGFIQFGSVEEEAGEKGGILKTVVGVVYEFKKGRAGRLLLCSLKPPERPSRCPWTLRI